MGIPSLFEDIQERQSELLRAVEELRLVRGAPIPDREKERIALLLSRLEFALSEARGILELATDPALDSVKALAEARDTTALVSARLHSYELSCASLMKALDAQRARANSLEQKLEDVTRDRNRAVKQLEETVKDGSAYAAFPPTKKTVRGKAPR